VKFKKDFSSIVHSLNELKKSGRLTTEEHFRIKKLIKKATHSLSVDNKKKLRETVNQICKEFIKKVRD